MRTADIIKQQLAPPGVLCAGINLAIREQGLSTNNVFSGTFIPDDEAKMQRLPIPIDVLFTIQHECMQMDDEPRWLIALWERLQPFCQIYVDF